MHIYSLHKRSNQWLYATAQTDLRMRLANEVIVRNL